MCWLSVSQQLLTGLILGMIKIFLEKEMATYSSILAWEKSHGQKSLAGCSPWGLHRVECELATKQQQQQKIFLCTEIVLSPGDSTGDFGQSRQYMPWRDRQLQRHPTSLWVEMV